MIHRLVEELGNFKVRSYETIGDGNCFFHAIANAFYIGYKNMEVDGVYMSREDIVRHLRKELADTLETIDPDTGISYYEQLANGNAADLGQTVEQYSLQGLKKHLNSNEPVGDVVITYVSYLLAKDIYILERSTGDVYVMADIPPGINTAVVILHSSGHYETVGILEDDQWITHFDSDHEFILTVRRRLVSLKSGQA